ncbi:MAG: 3-hydroxyacyl-CoA dehydrogenase NAD-binding domain-containing protein [Pseudomonadota bacterium]
MEIESVAIIGAGVIGAGWAARLIENAIGVKIYDPSPEAEDRLARVLENAERAYAKLTMAARPETGQITICKSIADAVGNADWVIESVPEQYDLKIAVLEEIEAEAPANSIITSSTSAIAPSRLQQGMSNPERFFVAHPFNPVYLLPAVEIVAGAATSHQSVKGGISFLSSIGMKPVQLTKETDGFVASRLLEAIWKEALHLVDRDVCTTDELDEIIRNGFGLVFAQMGMFETFQLADGSENVAVTKGVSQIERQPTPHSLFELERIRDDNLVAIQQALKANEWGAGLVLGEYEKKLFDAGAAKSDGSDYSKPIVTLERRVPPDWTDYNNHMNEARYLQCFGDATDAFMRMMGVDADYIEKGMSFFTVETHIRHLEEVRVNEPIFATTQLIEAGGKKMHVFHHLYHKDGTLLATGEHLLLHVSLKERATCEPAAEVRSNLDEVAKAHANLPVPEGLGRAVGQKRS